MQSQGLFQKSIELPGLEASRVQPPGGRAVFTSFIGSHRPFEENRRVALFVFTVIDGECRLGAAKRGYAARVRSLRAATKPKRNEGFELF